MTLINRFLLTSGFTVLSVVAVLGGASAASSTRSFAAIKHHHAIQVRQPLYNYAPVAPVVRFTDEADAIRWANATEFGLVSYVYTRDLSRGLRVSEALEAGMIGLNRGLVSDPAAPFGGVKQSGIGREGAHDGLLEFTETKYIATDW